MMAAARPADRTLARQTAIGVSLAAAIVVAWLSIHIVGIFFWHWSLGTVPVAIVAILVQMGFTDDTRSQLLLSLLSFAVVIGLYLLTRARGGSVGPDELREQPASAGTQR